MDGLELSRRLYFDGVRPLLDKHLPDLAHSAALIGAGSEVLGFDTARSADHDWGSRLQLFLSAKDLARYGARVEEVLAAGLPESAGLVYHGVEQRHGVTVADLRSWLTGQLGFDPEQDIGTGDWLSTPAQVLAEVTGGAVHHDGLGRLEPVRDKLAWYPDDVWRYVLACQWQRIGQEAPFPGRCAEAGDELGSAVVTGRLVRDLMRLCLLIGRVFPPYAKWLGSALDRLPGAGALGPVLSAALAAGDWPERERHLVVAYETVAARQNGLGLVAEVDPRVRRFFDRPFLVPDSDGFVAALRTSDRPLTGAVDQFADNTDLLVSRERSRAVTAALYG